jgi:predicted ferric reductase/mono/diheme cytochrome c family protein
VRGPLVVALLCAVPVALWILAAPLDERFTGSYASLTSLAVMLAYAGTSAFALNLVLGARLRVVEWLFGGLDRMYRAHRLLGETAFVLLVGHVGLVLAGRATISAETALDTILPGAGFTVFAGVLAFTVMTVAILLTLFARLGHEVFVYVQRSFGFVFLLATYHALTTDGTTHHSGLLTGYLALLATLGIAAFAYRSVFGNALVRRRRYRVVEVHRLDDVVTEIVMEPRGRPIAYAPGQFVFVNFPTLELHALELSLSSQILSVRAGEIRNQFHPFSITSAPGDPELRITVKAVGDYTRALRRLEQGAEAVVEGAYGSFSHRTVPGRRQIWIAGGIGVTPFLGMARSISDDGLDVDFYYCVEHEEEAHFLEELRALEHARRNFRVVVVPRDREGFLTGQRLAAAHDDLADAEVLVCGPPAMIDSLRAQLAAEGHPPARFHAEEFSFASVGGASASPATVAAPSSAATHRVRSDGRVIAVLAALAFAALAFALGIAVGGTIASADDSGNGVPAQAVAEGSPEAGRTVFASAGCGECHAFAAAGSNGKVGPDLDERRPDASRVRDVVTDGRGVMPSYAERLTGRQVADVAAFVAARSRG